MRGSVDLLGLPEKLSRSGRSLVDWLTDMSLISAGGMAETDGYIGYMQPYATAHQALDEDIAFQAEVLNVARARPRCEAFV